MPLVKYVFRPGINKEGTNYSNENGWFDADKVRFRKGKPERIGGWEKNSPNSFFGTSRKLHTYSNVTGSIFTVVGTHQKLYIKEGLTFHDVTPIRNVNTNSITFAATNGSSTIVATDSGHGAKAGDFVTFAQAVSLGGLITADVLNQEYQIVSIRSSNEFTFTAKDTSGSTVTANSSDTGNGGSGVDGTYQINSGLDFYVKSTGWGVDGWGSGAWGSSTPLSAVNQLRLWSIDNFGNDAVACIRGGGIFYWDESSGTSTRATNISSVSGASNTPTVALQVLVSNVDRHVIAFGCNPIGSSTLDPLLVRFSDTESAADWTPTATNQAGGVQLSQGSQIVSAIQTRQEIIIFTDAGLISMRFVGSPFVYSFTEVAEGFSLIGPNASINADNKVYFMDRGGFYVYSGAVQRLPCTVLDHVLSDLNLDQAHKIHAGVNANANEIIWFYPSGDSTELDKYVIYNFLEKVWSIGTTTDNFVRTAWQDGNLLDFPIAPSKNSASVNENYIYDHEKGHGDDGSNFTAFIESSDFDLQPDGERYLHIQKFIPDVEFRNQTTVNDTVSFILKGRDYPLQDLSTLTTMDITPSSTFVNTRARSRQCALRVSNSSSNFGWRLGDVRMEIRPDGRR
tara:strand:- start:5775 stop:7643 length:1869 start_codon:yes stop_codon:yes gene_type:complete